MTDSVAQRLHRGVEPHHPADLYDAWLVAEVDATLALADWSAAPPDRKRNAYVAYAAALECEAHAARRLELCLTGAPR
jgi:hypothetical protein